jgi:hypothetical protein
MHDHTQAALQTHAHAPQTDVGGVGVEGSDPRLHALAALLASRDPAAGGSLGAVSAAVRFNLDSTPHNSHTHTHGIGRTDFSDGLDGEWYGKVTWMGHRAELLLVDDADRSLGKAHKKKDAKPGQLSEEELDDAVAQIGASDDGVDEFMTANERNAMSVRRAKKNCTWKIIAINADRMLTLTQRGRIATREDAVYYASEFVRKCKRVYADFVCVYVIESHEKQGFHIHMAMNRYYYVDRLRLMWHRTLTGLPLKKILRGEEAPGNVQVGKVIRSSKLVRYMTKYITKTFAEGIPRGARRFFASEGIQGPNVKRFRMPRSNGSEVLFARSTLEARGFKVVRIFETMIAGRRAIWLQGEMRSGENLSAAAEAGP